MRLGRCPLLRTRAEHGSRFQANHRRVATQLVLPPLLHAQFFADFRYREVRAKHFDLAVACAFILAELR
jgi:hypothetical protein